VILGNATSGKDKSVLATSLSSALCGISDLSSFLRLSYATLSGVSINTPRVQLQLQALTRAALDRGLHPSRTRCHVTKTGLKSWSRSQDTSICELA